MFSKQILQLIHHSYGKKGEKENKTFFFAVILDIFQGFTDMKRKDLNKSIIYYLLWWICRLCERHIWWMWIFFMAPGTTERSQEDNSGAPSCLFPDPALFLIPSICLFTVPSFQRPYSNTGARNPWNLLSQGFALLQRDWARWVGGCPLLPGWRKSNQLILTEIN